jgi:hypothetical protein
MTNTAPTHSTTLSLEGHHAQCGISNFSVDYPEVPSTNLLSHSPKLKAIIIKRLAQVGSFVKLGFSVSKVTDKKSS